MDFNTSASPLTVSWWLLAILLIAFTLLITAWAIRQIRHNRNTALAAQIAMRGAVADSNIKPGGIQIVDRVSATAYTDHDPHALRHMQMQEAMRETQHSLWMANVTTLRQQRELRLLNKALSRAARRNKILRAKVDLFRGMLTRDRS